VRPPGGRRCDRSPAVWAVELDAKKADVERRIAVAAAARDCPADLGRQPRFWSDHIRATNLVSCIYGAGVYSALNLGNCAQGRFRLPERAPRSSQADAASHLPGAAWTGRNTSLTISSPGLTTAKAGRSARVKRKLHATKEAVQVMSSSADSAEADSMSSDPAALGRDIEEVRGELANTVEALAAKADVKSRVQQKVQELKGRATHKAQEVRAQAMAKVPQLTTTAQQKAQQVQRVVERKPGAAVGAVLAVLGLLVLGCRRRQRRREKD
jgi:ElaB/YqjD/DUF883 family membrane-anchored ribosome-binding protein